MISFLRGRVFAAGSQYVDVDVAGVGYRVHVPERIALAAVPNAECLLYTHQHVREDALLLFGFTDAGDRDFFELLIGVSGIGPKGALVVVNAMSAAGFYTAVANEDVATLCRLPGIGKKTAQRLVVELKDRIHPYLAAASATEMLSAPRLPVGRAPLVDGMAGDVVAALQNLGYAEKQVLETVVAVFEQHNPDSFEAALKRCLQELYPQHAR